MNDLKPCPFCGCNMKLWRKKYPDGSEGIEPYGFHEYDCVMDGVLWCLWPEDGWTEEKIADAWNNREGEP